MIRRLLFSTVACVLCASQGSAQQRPAIRPADYGQWETLAAAQLSPDGRWLAYGINRVNEENELRLRSLARDTTLVFRYGGVASFTPNSRWLGLSISVSSAERERLTQQNRPVRSRFLLIDLQSMDTASTPDIAAFRFSADGRFVALRGYAAEGRDAADIVVREMATGASTTFGNVADFAWSEAAPLLAFTVQTSTGTGNGVQVWNAETGTLRVLDSSDDRYRALAWREDAADLTVLRTRADTLWRDTTHTVLAWRNLRAATPAALMLDPVATAGLAPDLRIAEHRTPSWSEDGTFLYIGLRPRERAKADPPARSEPGDSARNAQDSTRAKPADEKLTDVQVWHARDVRIIPMQKAQEQIDLRRTLLAAWHPVENRIVQIGTDLLESATVVPGDRYATETDRTPYAFGTMFGRPSQDVYVIDVRTGERRKTLEDIRFYQGASAGGKYLLWFDGADYWTHDLASGARTNVTAAIDATFENNEYDYPVDRLPPRGTAGWTANDARLLVYDEYDLWSVAADGSGGRRLTDGAGERVTHRYLRTQGEFRDPIDLSRPLYLSINGDRTKKSGFARLRAGRAAERLLFEDARTGRLTRADSADVFAFTRERFDDSPDWFIGGGTLADARQVTSTNPFQADFAWGRAELVDFTSRAGEELQAVLLYPAQYDATRRYPMIVYTYELLSQNLHVYEAPSERDYYNNTAWTANGYFVLLPDIVYRGRDPGVSALDAVEPAVQKIIDKGVVDPARIGLVGHSWGGYQATYLPTRTNIFAASVAGAPITNFLSFAGAIHWNPGIAEFDHWETGQARMDVPPWEDFDAYLRNSPIHKVQDLETPMLMVFGDADGVVDWHQGIEFYNFARRAGKEDFVMLVYPGEDHGLRKKENQIDYHRRIQQWFGHWLKGEEAPHWMTEGVTWLDRKRTLEKR